MSPETYILRVGEVKILTQSEKSDLVAWKWPGLDP